MKMENELAVTRFDEIEKIAKAMVQSGFFKDTAQVAQAQVKIMAGQELGFGAFASMSGLYIIQGKISISAGLMSTAVKRSGRYDYKVLTMTDQLCELEFYQDGKPVGKSPFSAADAAKAGTQNMQKFPKNMLFSRAMSNGVKWYCPDVFMRFGSVYTPEELGASVNEDGNVIDGTARDVTPPASQPQQPTSQPPADEQSDQSPLEKAWTAWYALLAEATEAGIENIVQIPETFTIEQIRAAYKVLSGRLKAVRS
jgi:hypothetical protein